MQISSFTPDLWNLQLWKWAQQRDNMSSGGSEVLRFENHCLYPPPSSGMNLQRRRKGNEQAAVKPPQAGRTELSATSKAVKRPRFYLQSL